MKKISIIVLAFTIICALCFATGCGNSKIGGSGLSDLFSDTPNGTVIADDDPVINNKELSNDELFLEWLKDCDVSSEEAFAESISAESDKDYVHDYFDSFKQIELKSGECYMDDGKFMLYVIKYTRDGQELKGPELFTKEDGKLKLYLNLSELETVYKSLLCPDCGGSGTIHTGAIVCGICSGTGQQWYPNVFFDGNMWQGAFQACSGCGGSGFTDPGTVVACPRCGGVGMIRK